MLVRVSKNPTVKERIQPFFSSRIFSTRTTHITRTTTKLPLSYPPYIPLSHPYSTTLAHLFIDVDSSRFIQKDRIGFYRWNRAVRHGRKRNWKRRSFRVDWNGFRSSMGCLGRRDSKRKIWRVHLLSNGINFWFGWLSLFFLFAEKHILFLRDFVVSSR